MSAQDDARDILAALRGADNPAEVAHPGEPPTTKGMNEDAARKVTGDYDAKLQAYGGYLLSKPAGALTQAEQRFMWAELGKLRRGE
jgi:hypothetical protein